MNDDLISRQAAIDAFWKLDIELRPSAIDAITDMLKTLPSAQLVAKDTNVPSKDCISRQAAVEEIARRDTTDGNVKVFSGQEIISILHSMPQAVPRMRGRWLSGTCSCCGGHAPFWAMARARRPTPRTTRKAGRSRAGRKKSRMQAADRGAGCTRPTS